MVHRDLKTKNILVKSDGDCVISDFNVSIRFPLSDQDGHGQVRKCVWPKQLGGHDQMNEWV